MEVTQTQIVKETPVALVRTWITLASSKKTSQEVKDRALFMLSEKVGTPEDIAIFMKNHGIK